MMRSRIWGIVFSLCFSLLICTVPVWAQPSLEFSGGMANPTGDLNKFWNWGPGISGTFLMPISPFTRGGITVGYSRMGLAKSELLTAKNAPTGTALSGGDVSLINICLELRLQAGAMDKAVFFGGGGAGLFVFATSDLKESYQGGTTTTTYDNQNRFGGYLNAGVGIPVIPVLKLGAKVQYNFYTVGGQGFPDISDTRNFFLIQGMIMIDI